MGREEADLLERANQARFKATLRGTSPTRIAIARYCCLGSRAPAPPISQASTWTVHAVTNYKDEQDQTRWTRIGAMFPNSKGGYRIVLELLPRDPTVSTSSRCRRASAKRPEVRAAKRPTTAVAQPHRFG